MNATALRASSIGQDGENLVFLMSMPRSGSTLLSMMLSAHSDIACPPETWLLLFSSECFNEADVRKTLYGRNNAQMAAMDFLLASEYESSGFLADVIGQLGRQLFSGKPTSIAAGFAKQAINRYLQTTGKQLFVDKTPRYYSILPFIDQYFSRARKIFIKRNPLDVAASYMKTWSIPVDELLGHPLTVNTRDFVEGLFVYSNYFANSNPLHHVISYESLVANSSDEISRLCEFLGVTFQEDMLSFFNNETIIKSYAASAMGDSLVSRNPRAANTNSVGRGLVELEKEGLQHLVDMLGGKVFVDLGYGDVLKQLEALGYSIPKETDAQAVRASLRKKLETDNALLVDRQHLPGKERDLISSLLRQSEIDRSQRKEQIDTLTAMLSQSDEDRFHRWRQIEELTAWLKQSEAEKTVLSGQVSELNAALVEADSDRTARGEQIESLAAMLRESEADRTARGEQIESLAAMLRDSEADRTARGEEIESLAAMLRESETDRTARGEQIESLTAMLKASETDRAARGEQIESLTAMLKASESERAVRCEQLRAITGEVRVLLARSSIRWLVRFSDWPEIAKLTERISTSNE